MRSIDLYDKLGRHVLNKAIDNQTSIELNLPVLNRGMYFIKVISNDGTAIQKLIVQ